MSDVKTTPNEDSPSLLLNDLPVEVLLSILQNCCVQDLSALSQTCMNLRDLSANEDLWNFFCKKDFGVNDLETNSLSYRELYTGLLHKHGWMMGLYHCQSEPYGGLLEVRYQNGEIQGNMCIANSHTPGCSLDRIKMFVIKPKSLHPQCLLDTFITHKVEICKQNNGKFIYKCPNINVHRRIEDKQCTKNHEMKFKGIVYDPFHIQNLAFITQNMMTNEKPCSQIITPGLFTGIYGKHGIEIVYFSFYEENIIQGVKITGDPNVFSGNVSIIFDIQYAFNPTLSEQESFKVLSSMSPVVSETPINLLPCQKFVLPYDCSIETIETDVPDQCYAQYHGGGQIADDQYCNPSMTPVQVVIFNNNLIGAVWIELKKFMLFHRIRDIS